MPNVELKSKTEQLFVRLIDAMLAMTDDELLKWRGLSSTIRVLSEHVHREQQLQARESAFTLIEDLVDQAEHPEFDQDLM